jgi:hypothetical protein
LALAFRGETIGVKAKVGVVFTGAKVKIFERPKRRRDVNVSLVNFYYKGGEYKCCSSKTCAGKKITKLKDGKISIDFKKLKELPSHAVQCVTGVKNSFNQQQFNGEDDDEGEDDRKAGEIINKVLEQIGGSCGLAIKDIKDAVSPCPWRPRATPRPRTRRPCSRPRGLSRRSEAA